MMDGSASDMLATKSDRLKNTVSQNDSEFATTAVTCRVPELSTHRQR